MLLSYFEDKGIVRGCMKKLHALLVHKYCEACDQLVTISYRIGCHSPGPNWCSGSLN